MKFVTAAGYLSLGIGMAFGYGEKNSQFNNEVNRDIDRFRVRDYESRLIADSEFGNWNDVAKDFVNLTNAENDLDKDEKALLIDKLLKALRENTLEVADQQRLLDFLYSIMNTIEDKGMENMTTKINAFKNFCDGYTKDGRKTKCEVALYKGANKIFEVTEEVEKILNELKARLDAEKAADKAEAKAKIEVEEAEIKVLNNELQHLKDDLHAKSNQSNNNN